MQYLTHQNIESNQQCSRQYHYLYYVPFSHVLKGSEATKQGQPNTLGCLGIRETKTNLNTTPAC
ncbi:hypothetical protein H5410_022067 [Solanum commersonii]|uniref:Uncharacterized protein n=1 Tax=Solanum commersonii TaxID=4109 RepID=A0A9J5ZDQ5_SOLCO|nr:hypothetical protein H5410_022067 [Solanum commersonii]